MPQFLELWLELHLYESFDHGIVDIAPHGGQQVIESHALTSGRVEGHHGVGVVEPHTVGAATVTAGGR